MSNLNQSKDDLDAVLHWRGKHALAIKERDALQRRLTAADERNDNRDFEIFAQVQSALRRSFSLGQIYWQQADSDSTCQQNKSDQTMEVQVQHILNVLKSLSAALKPAEGSTPPTCTWSHDGIGIWAGSCGTKWAFTDDGPTENGMRFCPCCGKTLVMADEDESDDD